VSGAIRVRTDLLVPGSSAVGRIVAKVRVPVPINGSDSVDVTYIPGISTIIVPGLLSVGKMVVTVVGPVREPVPV
jgi:hypothetical protein